MMNIGCIYTIEDYATVDKPLAKSTQIPYGISLIATILKEENYDVSLFVLCPDTQLEKVLGNYIRARQPKLFCLTAVSTQFSLIEKIAQFIKNTDPEIFIILGGHHASLASESVIQSPYLDAICIGEGDVAVIELAYQIYSSKKKVSNITNLWIKDRSTGLIEKNPVMPFNQELDKLPFIDRTMWDRWIMNPQEEASVLVGRGCPYKCTYCSNHAMSRLANGKYVRYRTPGSLIGEIEYISMQYPELKRIYLEVETIGANMGIALELFQALAEYNSKRTDKYYFGMNLALHSNFVKSKEEILQFFHYCKKANVTSLNIGLESGSEKIRDKVLRRPKYTNDEIVDFSLLAKDFGIKIFIFVLIGIPGETPEDFRETVEVARRIQPEFVYLSIFYPYIGTDLYKLAVQKGYLPDSKLDTSAERRKPVLAMPEFSKRRIRAEQILFWYKVYKGVWPLSRILIYMIKIYITPYRTIQRIYRYVVNSSKAFYFLKDRVQKVQKAEKKQEAQHALIES